MALSVRKYTTPSGILITLDNGAIREESKTLIARASAPLISGRIERKTGQSYTGPDTLELFFDNLMDSATFQPLHVERAKVLTNGQCSGQFTTIVCSQLFDQACDFTFSKDPTYPTRFQLKGRIEECTKVVFEIVDSKPRNKVTIAIASDKSYQRLLEEIKQVGAAKKVDFVVLLGNFLTDYQATSKDPPPSPSGEEVEKLTQYLLTYPYPVILVAGKEEHLVTDKPGFVTRFGGGSYTFRLADTWFLPFDTEEKGMPTATTDGIRSLIGGIVTRYTGEYRNTPLVGLNFVPPLDPSGIGQRGFTNRWEGLSVTSMLSSFGMDLLVSGFTAASGKAMYAKMESVVLGSAFDSKVVWLEVGPGVVGRPMGESASQYRIIE